MGRGDEWPPLPPTSTPAAASPLPPPPAPADNAAMEAEPPKVELPKRKHRRFQFRLRTLMIVVTVFCVVVGGYVGWQLKIIRERHEAVATHRTTASIIIPIMGNNIRPLGSVTYRPKALWPLCWMGEDGYAQIDAGQMASDEEIANLKRLFPEADILQGAKRR